MSEPVMRLMGERYYFQCPGCDDVHTPDLTWGFNGNFDKPTLTPSVLVTRNHANPALRRCHSYVVDGRIEFLGDSTHHLAGKTVDLPALPDWLKP